MAELRKITANAVQSDFRRVTPQAGFAFAALGQMAEEAYKMLEPAAIADQQRKGAEAGREMARMRQGQRPPATPQQPAGPDGGLGRVGEAPAGGASTPRVTTTPLDDTPEAAVGRDAMRAIGRPPNDVQAFNEGLARTESGGDLNVVNAEGFTGRYQFGQERLDDFNRANGTSYSTADLRGNEALTEQVQNWHVGDIDRFIDRTGLDQFEGREVGGVVVTRNGMRAMAHLGGNEGMRRFLLSDGSYNPSDSNGTSLADYAATHGGGRAPARYESEPETTIRTSEGRIEPRLFSPMSGPIRQAYNAAAGVAYVSEMTVTGLEDLMNLSQENRSDPSAFENSAREYIDQIVEQAPEPFREDLRASLTTESQRRYLGMLDEQHRDADARANNSSKALMDRYSSDFAEALASGRSEDAAAARQNLEGILYARESLPGVAWTREQSENLIMSAMDEAENMRSKAMKRMSDEWKDQFNTAITAAKDGRTSDFDALVNNQAAIDAHPELAREAMAMMTVRDNMPGFMSATPDQQRQVLEQERSRPIGAQWETDVLDAMTKAHDATVAALEDDPIQYGMDHLRGAPPPLDPSLAASNPEGFVKAMEARREFADRMMKEGWINQPAIFSEAEAEMFGGLLAKDQPAELRSALAGAIVSGFGSDAVTAFGELDADPVTLFGGQLMAAGGSQATVQQAMMGQELLDANQVQLPSGSTRISAFAPEVAEALSGLSNPGAAQEQITKFAQALYASKAQGLDPSSDDAKALMKQAINQAMGQRQHPRMGALGGVQEVAGHQVLLPVGVSGRKVQQAIERSFSGEMAPRGIMERAVAGMMLSENLPSGGLVPEVWQNASPRGAVPMWGSQPMTQDLFRDGRVRIVAAGGNMYRMEVTLGETVTDITTEDGSVYMFDITKFME